MVFLNLGLNIYFGSLAFQIINFKSLKIHEIQFCYQILFFLFFGSWFERGDRKQLDSSGKKTCSQKLISLILCFEEGIELLWLHEIMSLWH